MQPTQCEDVVELVRNYFKRGYKSGNKAYLVNHAGALALTKPLPDDVFQKVLKREGDRIKSESKRPRFASNLTDFQRARQLLHVSYGEQAGNCYEMSLLAGYFAISVHHVGSDKLFLVSVNHPGDHVFCLFCPNPTSQIPTGIKAISGFSSQRLSPWKLPAQSYVMDPWLNVTCDARTYLEVAAVKLEEWTGKNKRLWWAAGSQKEGWYPPNGEYKEAMSRAPVKVESYRV